MYPATVLLHCGVHRADMTRSTTVQQEKSGVQSARSAKDSEVRTHVDVATRIQNMRQCSSGELKERQQGGPLITWLEEEQCMLVLEV
mmetsp:Transcript_25590/g.64185  ORF Transcript_25590/g.64185 Transcript_25590/m.64185 type:complete len:87 (-) Transcript_25590:1063-1323(-)